MNRMSGTYKTINRFNLHLIDVVEGKNMEQKYFNKQQPKTVKLLKIINVQI